LQPVEFRESFAAPSRSETINLTINADPSKKHKLYFSYNFGSSALDALSEAAKTANKLENPDLFTNSTSHQIIGKGFAYYIGYDVPGFDVSETFGGISKTDFQGALLQAENFTDRYIRTLAVLASVKDCESVKPIKAKPKASTK
jgi:hypothetical protein